MAPYYLVFSVQNVLSDSLKASKGRCRLYLSVTFLKILLFLKTDFEEHYTLLVCGIVSSTMQPLSSTCLDLVEAQREACGDHIVVEYLGDSLTYDELCQQVHIAAPCRKLTILQTTVLSERLLNAGAKQGDVVAICASEGFAMVTSMLSVWKIGAAFVTIDIEVRSFFPLSLFLSCSLSLLSLSLFILSCPSGVFGGYVLLRAIKIVLMQCLVSCCPSALVNGSSML